jgi:hypothetical protein
MDPLFMHQGSRKEGTTASGGCTGGATSSFQSSIKDYQEEPNNTSQSFIIDMDDFKKVKKRQQNKESAIRSRMKKKAYYETIETQVSSLQ